MTRLVLTARVTAVVLAWFVVDIAGMAWVHVRNLRRRVLYRRYWGRWCDHVQDHGGGAWSGWRVVADTAMEQRCCQACGVEQRRPAIWT